MGRFHADPVVDPNTIKSIYADIGASLNEINLTDQDTDWRVYLCGRVIHLFNIDEDESFLLTLLGMCVQGVLSAPQAAERLQEIREHVAASLPVQYQNELIDKIDAWAAEWQKRVLKGPYR